MSELRKSGIDVMGEIPLGSHFCNFYETKQDLIDMLVPYFKTGLENKEFCLWILSNSGLISMKEAKEALKQVVPDLERHLSDGDIEILNETGWYLEDNVFNLENVINGWHVKLKRVLALGYNGMRVSGDTFWLEEKYRKSFSDYEKQLNDFTTDLAVTILCTYPLAKSGAAEILDVAHNHQFAIARRKGEWEMIETSMQIQAQAEIKRLNKTLQKAKMQTTKPTEILRFVVAVLSVTLALIVAQFLDVHLVTAPVSLFFCAIMFSAWYGGIKPGLLSVALSLLAFKFFFVPPVYSLTLYLTEIPRLIIFALSALFVVSLSAAQRSVTESLRRARNVLEGTVQKLMQTNTMLQAEIADRKKSGLLIIEEKELSNEIIDSIPGVFMLLDENFRIVRWNKNVELVSGYTAKEIPQLHAINDFYDDADDRKKVRSLMEEAFEKGTIHAEASPHTKDGRRIFFYFNARLINYEGKRCILCTAIDISERKRAEDELRLAYQRLSYLFGNTPLAVIELDKDLFIKRWSKRAEEIFGWKASEAIGKNVYDPDFPIIYTEDIPAVDAINEQLTKGTVNRNLSLNRNCTRNGEVIYCEWYNSVLRNKQGNVITILSLVHDVTERKKAEEQKEFERRDKEALINATDDLIWSISKDFKLIAVNKAFVRHLEDLVGVTFGPGDEVLLQDVIPGDVLAFWRRAYNRAWPGETFKEETYIPAQNKLAESWWETSFNPIYSDETVVALACYARNITERKFAEVRIRLSEAHLAEAQRLAKLGSWDFDIKTDMLTWSEELYHVFGTDKRTFRETHSSFLHLVDTEDREFALQTSMQAQQSGEPFTIEYRITTPNGERRVIQEHGYGQKDDNGKVFRLFGTAQDITERKKAEEELQLLNEELRRLSSHLQNIQENERTAIAREIHDEFGQQLTALKMDVEWLNKRLPDNAVLKVKMQDILSLITDILQTVKRIAIELRPAILDDLGLIAALEWQGQELEKRTGIKYQFHTDLTDFNPGGNLSTNIFRIYQEALTNVARHAQATEIETTLEAKDGHIKLIIKDNGQGFELNEVKKNSSLGLTGMNERTLMLHGELSIETKKLNGTVITLKVPLL